MKKKEKSLKNNTQLSSNEVKQLKFTIIKICIITAILVAFVALSYFFVGNRSITNQGLSQELLRARNYAEYGKGEEDVEQTEGNVKFSAFFLRDLDLDGNAEKIKGTCKEIGAEDTLYMELIVQTGGYLKNGKIEIQGKNFYLQTALPEDKELKANYIGTNIKTIEFKDIKNGSQKLISGMVRSGNYSSSSQKAVAIGNNKNNYSVTDNKVIFTGKYVTEGNQEIDIRKEIDLTVDWYGTTKASISNTTQTYRTLEDIIDEENGKISLSFSVTTKETEEKLIVSKAHLEGEIPELGGEKPLEVTMTSGAGNLTYNPDTRTFTIDKEAVADDTGKVTNSVSRTNTYTIKVVYPIEAYQNLGTESVEFLIPVRAYYEGYNNPNTEFNNPYKSNIANATIKAYFEKKPVAVDTVYNTNFSITVGKYIYTPFGRYVISKEKPLRIYNGNSEEEKDDTYLVTWYAYIGTNEETNGLVLKETKTNEEQKNDMFVKQDLTEESMENVSKNIGIYFGGASQILGEEGWIKVYDDETGNLLVTFDNTNIGKYTSSNPYKYETPVKHIRVETSQVANEKSLYVYNIKEIDDEYLTDNYSKEVFDSFNYIKSTLSVYIGENFKGQQSNRANYEAPISIANISISKDTISTQVTEKSEKIKISTVYNSGNNQLKWENGSFLVKLPQEILTVKINGVQINNDDVTVKSYETIKTEEGNFIKINTENSTPQTYTITIDADITPDPRKGTSTKDIELYASNSTGTDYYYKSADIYDVNNNLNDAEIINKTTTKINLISPNSLLTNQIASNYDNNGSEIISPETAEIKPLYVTVENQENTAKIGVQIRNNYADSVTDVKIIGKIPYTGNEYAISKEDLESEFITKMDKKGIEVPTELQGEVKVYYSEELNPTIDGKIDWKEKEQIQAEEWDNIKSYLIDFEDYVVETGKDYIFNYTIKISNDVAFNKTAYSHHGVYFSLITEQGKYKTSTEPNKLGFRIADKYDLELTKNQKGQEKTVPGATYKITEEGKEESITGMTGLDGKITFKDLYADKTYVITEIKVPEDYELNTEEIKFVGIIDRNTGNLSIEVKNEEEGITEDRFTVKQEEHKVELKVEDEAKARLKIKKIEKGESQTPLPKVRYKITGEGLPTSGKALITDAQGEISLNGLKIGAEYTLEEVKAEGYYLASPIIFKINNEGSYGVEIINEEAQTQASIKQKEINLNEENIPVLNLILEDEKIPTCDLELLKIKKVEDVEVSSEQTEVNQESTQTVEPLSGAKFKLYKDNKEIGTYETGEEGKLTIPNLYQYVEGKDFEATYTLKEVMSPVGYAKVKDITFKIENVEGKPEFKEELQDGQSAKEWKVLEGNKIQITVEDNPAFKLVKKDAENKAPLANVKFAIYNVDNGTEPAKNSKGEIIGNKETINGKEYYVVETNEQGEITADLPEGLYKAVEVQADEKYDISQSIYYFGIGASREGIKSIEFESGKSAGGTSSDEITSVCTTEDGGYIVGGYFNTDITLEDGTELKNKGSSDGMIIKYKANGDVEWAKTVGGTNIDSIKSVCATKDGGFVVGGYFYSSTITLEDGTELKNSSNYSSDGMIIKYKANGTVEWGKSIGDYIYSVCATEDGGFVVGGSFSKITLEDGIELTTKGSSDGMIIKYKANGDVEWAKTVGGTNSDSIKSVCATKDGGFVVGGFFYSSTITLDNGTELKNNSNSTSYSDGIIIKYKENGDIEWEKTIGGTFSRNDYIESVCATEDGGFVVGGSFSTITITLDNGVELKNNSNTTSYSDGMIIKYKANGTVEWGRSIGEQKDDEINSICATEDGGYIAGGYFKSETITLEDGTKLKNKGFSDGMIIIFHNIQIPEVVIKNPKVVGGTNSDGINSVCATGDGGYIVGGYFNTDITLEDGTELKNKGSSDGMIIKYNSNGAVEWAKTVGGRDSDRINSVCVTKDGGYIAGGYFREYYLQDTITLEDGTELKTKGSSDGMIIKYKANGDVEWAKTVGGTNSDSINSVCATKDGGFVVGGSFYSRTITLDNGTELTKKGINTCDGMIIKYKANGEAEWGKSVGGVEDDGITSVCATENGGYIVVGYFKSDTITLEDGTELRIADHLSKDGIIIKYKANGEVEWGKSVGGRQDDEIKSVCATKDGGFVVGGQFYGPTIQLDEKHTLTNKDYDYDHDGMVIKYNAEGEVDWVQSIGGTWYDEINSICATKDGGFVVVGAFSSPTITLDNGTKLTSKNGLGLMIIKYKSNKVIEWVKSIGGTSYDEITTICETSDGEYIAGGYFKSDTITLEDGTELKNNSSSTSYLDYSDGIIIKILEEMGAPEVQKLEVENKIKEFKITTEVEEVDGYKGGTISGENKSVYESVKYGNPNTLDIVMEPEDGYEIVKITVNGEEQKFEITEENGKYTLPKFDSVTEDKHIVVTYNKKDNKIVINKVDSETKERIPGVKFKLDQLEERPELKDEIQEIEGNGQEYNEIIYEKEITSNTLKLDQINHLDTDNYWFEKTENGEYIPTNSKTYQTQNVDGETEGKPSSTAHSYIPIDLSNEEYTGKKFKVVINATVSSERYDYGYAIINTDTASPTRTSATGRVIYQSGNYSAQDYISEALEGGQLYYLHLGYYKDNGTDTNDDWIKFNSIKVYETTPKIYNFSNIEGIYESTNQGKNSTVANSYIPINMQDLKGTYKIIVKAKISTQSGDYGYVTINNSQTRPSYSATSGRFVYITGEQEEQEYISNPITAGQMYYLHLGYYKDSKTNTTGEDKFTVTSVRVVPNEDDLYHTEIETNIEGQAIAQIPFGKYEITEISAPDGYQPLAGTITINFKDGDKSIVEKAEGVTAKVDGVEFEIENEKFAKVNVHHLTKNSKQKIAPDVVEEGIPGDPYTTEPHLDLQKYELEKKEDGSLVLPPNATGEFEIVEQDVEYLYVERETPLIVHHYILGTEDKVPLKEGKEAEDVTESGAPGTGYTTSAIDPEQLDDKYELVQTPGNATGTYGEEEEVVTYYYDLIKRDLKIKKLDEDKITPLAGVEFKLKNTETEEEKDGTTDSNGEILWENVVKGTYELTEEKVPEGYVLPKEASQTIVMENDDKEVQIINEKARGKVTVHHYIARAEENGDITLTSEQVPSKEADIPVADEEMTGIVGEIFATQESPNISTKYVYYSSTEKTSGTYSEKEQEVIYYYILNEYEYKVEYYYNWEHESGSDVVKEATYNTQITKEQVDLNPKIGYRLATQEELEAKDIKGNLGEGTANLPLTITRNPKENVIRVYYVKRTDLKYKIQYYYSNVLKDELTEEIPNQTFEDIITRDDIEEKITQNTEKGYRLAKSEEITDLEEKTADNGVVGTPLTIKVDENENIIKVYYMPDENQKKTLKYTVEYYKDEVKQERDTVEDEQEVQYLAEDNIKVNKDNTVVEGKYSGYRFDKITIEYPGQEENNIDKESIPTEVQDKTIIRIYYVKRTDLKYSIEYYYSNQKDTGLTEEIGGQTFESEITREMILSKIETNKKEGYRLAEKEEILELPDETTVDEGVVGTPLIIEADESRNVIKVYYEKRNDLKYKIEYYYSNVLKKELTEEISNQVFEDTITRENISSKIEKNMTKGYRLSRDEEIKDLGGKTAENGVVGTPLTIKVDENENIIKVYYEIDENQEKTLTYTVEYYKDETLDDTDTESKTVQVLQDDILEVNKDNIETEGKYPGYRFDRLTIEYPDGDEEEIDVSEIPDNVDDKTIIRVYYVKRTDLSYTVQYYYSNKIDSSLTEEVGNQTFENVITREMIQTGIDTNKKYGYRLAKSEEIIDLGEKTADNGVVGIPLTISANVEENIIKVYYMPDEEQKKTLRYDVQYYKEEVEVTEDKITKEEEVQVLQPDTLDVEKEEIKVEGKYPGYKLDRITVTQEGGQEVKVNNIPENVNDKTIIKLYYVKDKFGYKIEYYYDWEIDGKLTKEETATYEDVIDTYTDVEKYGYRLATQEEIEAKQEEGVVEEGVVGEGTLGLPLQITEIADNNVIRVYHVRKDAKVVVKYVDRATKGEIAERQEKTGLVFDEYDVSDKEQEIDDYTLVEKPNPTTGTYTEEEQEKVYYYAKNTRVIVKYLEKDETPDTIEDNLVLHPEVVLDGYEGMHYDTVQEKIENYTYVENSGNITGEMERETITVIYYYLQNTKVIVNHIDKITDVKMAVEEQEGKVGDIYTAKPKDFTGYVLVERPEEETVKMRKEVIELNYYYVHVSEGVVEKHIDIKTDTLLEDETVYEGHEGDPYTTKAKEFEGYYIVTNERYYKEKEGKEVPEELNPEDDYIPENSEGKMTIDLIEVKYYYIRKASVKVEYIDKVTGETIPETVIKEDESTELKDSTEHIYGHEDDPYKTEEKTFEGYNILTNKQYYEYIGESLPEGLNPEDKYIPENSEGNMKITKNEDGSIDTEILVRYYYVHESEGVIERHIDIKSGKLLEPEVKYEGQEGDPYTTKVKEFEGYDTVTNERYYKEKEEEMPEEMNPEDEYIPSNKEGNMTKELIEVNYYYIRRTSVRVEYLDRVTGENLLEIDEKTQTGKDSTEHIYGHEGDEYVTEEKEFKDYLIVEEMYPENKEGNMGVVEKEDGSIETETVVKYYYAHPSSGVVEKHIDIITGELMERETRYEGKEGDEYKTKEKDFKGYDLVKDQYPSNSEGKMTIEEIEVRYYYIRKIIVRVERLEIGTEKKLVPDEVIEGHEGDRYYTESKEIPGFDLLYDKIPDNKDGVMQKKDILVRYYYESDTVKETGGSNNTPQVQVPQSNNKTNNKVISPATGDMVPVIAIGAIVLVIIANIIVIIINKRKKNKKFEK